MLVHSISATKLSLYESARPDQVELDANCLRVLRAMIHNTECKLPKDVMEHPPEDTEQWVNRLNTEICELRRYSWVENICFQISVANFKHEISISFLYHGSLWQSCKLKHVPCLVATGYVSQTSKASSIRHFIIPYQCSAKSIRSRLWWSLFQPSLFSTLNDVPWMRLSACVRNTGILMLHQREYITQSQHTSGNYWNGR